jgi:cadmium resistance protein CadD (predicted permease)
MTDVLTIAAMTAAAYIGTSLDNLILLTAFYSRYISHAKLVTAGYIGGMILIGLLIFIIGEAGDLIPVAYLGSLGVIPIVIGVKGLVEQFHKRLPGDPEAAIANGGRTVFLSVLLTQLGNSTDTIITFSVLQFDSKDTMDYVISGTFVLMAFVFAGIGYYAIKHQKLQGFLARYGRWLTPFILILVGIYIINDTATDLVN